MKRNILTVSVMLLTLFIQPIQANDMLMDPMPAAKPAPDFNLMGMDGETHSLEDLKGKFVLVNFWATWCNPCKVEMPLLEKLHQTLKSDKFTVLGLHVGPGPENIEEFKKLMPISFPIYVDMDLEVNWGVPGLPTTFLMNPEGKLIYRAVGKREFASDDMVNFLKSQIESYQFAQKYDGKFIPPMMR
jgi:thiol-disulfide isomerase/thioredoxin